MRYEDLFNSIGYSSDNLALHNAYKENGIITITINVPSNVSGLFYAQINSNYAPRIVSFGTVCCLSSANDISKIPAAEITADGKFIIWIAQSLSGAEQIQFSYPLKK